MLNKHTFLEFVKLQGLFEPRQKLLLAVSGGLDSAVLCHLCATAELDFEIAHCNFQLRGQESDRDQQFVESLAIRYQRPLRVKRFDTLTYAAEKKQNIQMAARELRYGWFGELMDQSPPAPRWLLTGHHQDDNVETLLMNFFKGTGIRGLRGMQPRNGRILRPLLFAKKEELLAYARQENLSWQQDSSNDSDDYSRNFLRHRIIPLVEKIIPAAGDNLAASLPRFAEIESLYSQALSLHKGRLLEFKGQEIHIPVLKLKKTIPLQTVVYEIMREYGFRATQTKEIISLLDSDSGRFVSSASHRVIRHRKWLIIAALSPLPQGTLIIQQQDRQVLGPGFMLKISSLVTPAEKLTGDPNCASLDAAGLDFPLILRPWHQGDYFYPLGMNKKKKVSRFLIDRKLSKTQKEQVWVLESSNRIAWVLGQQIDNRFRIGPGTQKMVRLELNIPVNP